MPRHSEPPPPRNGPTVWTRLRIRATGLVPTDELESYRLASLEVWDLVESAAERRRSGEIAPVENLGAWIAFCLQTYGNALLDADLAADPATAHHVPRVLHGAVLGLYIEVGLWHLRATESRGRPAYTLRRKAPLPLPPLPREIREGALAVEALMVILRAMRDELPHVPVLPGCEARIETALAAARYAEALVPPGGVSAKRPHPELSLALRRAAGELFRTGQIAAIPAFADPFGRGEEPPRRLDEPDGLH